MKLFRRCCWMLAILLAVSAMATAQTPASDPSSAIQTLLIRQAADWNRGDLEAFAAGYKNSPDILFMGRSIAHGYAGMLDGYKKAFPDRQHMGRLSFTALEAQPLDARFATATGQYHLARTAAGGGNASGYFLLVLEKTEAGWKIIRDDTTTTAPRH